MKKYIILAALIAAIPALAEDKKPEVVQLSLTPDETNILWASLQNAGAACDAGVPIYCQIAGVREPLKAKIKAALPNKGK